MFAIHPTGLNAFTSRGYKVISRHYLPRTKTAEEPYISGLECGNFLVLCRNGRVKHNCHKHQEASSCSEFRVQNHHKNQEI